MVTTNSHLGSHRETYLKNESTSISDLSQGKRKGVIAETGETWLDSLAAENTDTAQFEYQTTLKGEWTGPRFPSDGCQCVDFCKQTNK